MKTLICTLAVLFVVGSLPAQMTGTGAYPFSSFDNKGFDSINLGNLDTRFAVPILNRTGRGMGFTYAIQNEGLIWRPATSGSTTAWIPDSNWGFNGQLNGTNFAGYLTNTTQILSCGGTGRGGSYQQLRLSNFVYHDVFGAIHTFNYTQLNPCTNTSGNPTITGDGSTMDGSGYSLVSLTQVRARNGTIITPASSPTGANPTSITDLRGNTITATGGNSFTDTLGVSALTISGSGSHTFTYPVTLQSDSATTASSTLSYKQYTVRTNFRCSGIIEYGSTSVNLVDRITLADGTFYAFTYEPTPSATDGAVTARLASITLPTGGVISYTYTGGCNGSGINADGTTSGLTRSTADGTKTYVRAVVNATSTSTTATDEKGNVSVYQFGEDTVSAQFYETHRQVYQGSTSGGILLLDQSTCYNGATAPCDGTAMALPILNTTILSSYNGGSQATTKNVYNAAGLLTSSAMLGGSTTLVSTAYAYNGFGELTSFVTSDGSSNTVSATTYGYDETTPTATTGIPQHTAPRTAEGNQTSVHVFTASGTSLTTTTAYYDTGIPVTTTTSSGTTGYVYDATQTFATQTNFPTPSSGVALSTSATYDTQSAMPLSVTGFNSGQKATVASYDRLLRPLVVNLPNGGSTSFSYSPNQTGAYQTLSSSVSTNTQTLYDGYGRVSRAAVANGQSTNPYYQSDSCYDASGLLLFQPVPYQGVGWGTPKQCSGAGVTYSYDALGRVTSTQTSDGTATAQYTNRAVLTKDVNGVQRITQYDLLGRISGICELSSNSLAGQSPTSCNMDIAGTGYLTSYGYNLATHTTTITQGAQIRTFVTDWAGRPTSTTEPERNTTGYSYVYNGTGLQTVRTRPKANQTNASVLTQTTTQYDALGRIVSISYDDGITPTKNYFYDTASAGLQWSQTPANPKGLLTGTSSGLGATLTRSQPSYDLMGNVVSFLQCAPSTCGGSSQASRTLQFAYDLGSNLTSESDPASGTIAYGRSIAGEVTSITNQSYTNNGNPPNLVSNVVNGPNGPISYALGNGLNIYKAYDASGRFSNQWVCTGSPQFNCPTQIYGTDASHSGTRVTFMDDTLLGASRSFGYDEFNRLSSSVRVNNTSQSNFTYTYDRYGNRMSQTVTQGSGPQPSFGVDPSSNRIISNGYSYDAAGNLASDSFHSYVYDAEGNILSVDGGSTAQYVYDAFNRRVRVQTPGSTYEYLFDFAGRRTSSWLLNGSPAGFGIEGRIYWGGSQIAYRSQDGTTYFEHKDVLGTERMRTNYQGSIASSYVSLPFGDGYAANEVTAAGGQDNDHFASLDHDTESATEHAQFRQYSSTLGRWMSPDPYNGSYDFSNPQSLNRFTYALNNPLSLVDPIGLDTSYCGDFDCTVTCDDCGDGGSGDDGSGGAYGGNAGSGGGGSGGNGGGGGGQAPNKGPSYDSAQVCAASALLSNGASIGLDTASTLLGLVGGGWLTFGAQVAVSAGSYANSVASDPPGTTSVGTSSGLLGYLLTIGGISQVNQPPIPKVGALLPAVGTLIGGISLANDLGHYKADYRSCLKELGG